MYEHLLSPVRVGQLELRNRIAMAPMGVEIVDGDGHAREPVIRYYEERARGGAGLLITENTAACYPRGANTAHEIAVSDDAYLPGLATLTRAVHAHGAKIAPQLALATSRVRLGTSVISLWSRTPGMLAQSAASLDEVDTLICGAIDRPQLAGLIAASRTRTSARWLAPLAHSERELIDPRHWPEPGP